MRIRETRSFTKLCDIGFVEGDIHVSCHYTSYNFYYYRCIYYFRGILMPHNSISSTSLFLLLLFTIIM